MQQFVVPQFIDAEDKIIGPITTRQFLILLFASGIVFLAFRFGDLALFLLVLVVVGGIAVAFAFIKINGQTFHYFVLNVSQNLINPTLSVWNKGYTNKELNILRLREAFEAKEEKVFKKPVERVRIRDLSLIVNTGGYYQGSDQ